ncbi:MAG: Crp/Fnr family transcriptional regulator [Spirochaetes bacterium]|nr:Crp/Fnr family transcriptional regulator [Spirochaetota bacterium]
MASTQFKVVNYLTRSFIIVEGKKNADNFYIIRSGNVKIIKENPTIADDTSSVLGPGDFFGVISCMSNRARIETAVAVSNVSLISVEREQFGMLIQKNPVIAMKIIRFFSRRLRLFNQAITRLTLQNAAEENFEHLFTIGEYYYKKKSLRHAIYAYQKYIENCPNGNNVEDAISSLKSMNAPLKVPENPANELKKVYPDNMMIFCENEPGSEVYIIQSGKVKITRISGDEEMLLAVLKPGDIFGEQSLLDNKPRNASAISFGDVSLMAINKANFEEMVHMKPQLAIKIISLLSERIWTAYRQLENLTIKDPLARIYDILLLQLEKQKIALHSHNAHNFEIGTNELLQMVGIPPEKGSILISQFLEDKFFTLEGGKIVCKNLEELEKSVQYFKKKAMMDKKREESKVY